MKKIRIDDMVDIFEQFHNELSLSNLETFHANDISSVAAILTAGYTIGNAQLHAGVADQESGGDSP